MGSLKVKNIMKYIKTYKLFESSSDEEEIINYLKDIYLEVEDQDIYLEVEDQDIDVHITKEYSYYREVNNDGENKEVMKLYKIIVNIGKVMLNQYLDLEFGRSFTLEEVYDTILTSKSYMSDEGFFISNIKVDSFPNKSKQCHTVRYRYDLFDNFLFFYILSHL